MRRSVLIAAGLLLVLVLVLGGVAVREFANEAEAPEEPTVMPAATYTPTAYPMATPTPTATPSGLAYTNPDTGVLCYNVITQEGIDALSAFDKVTLPLLPCTEFGLPKRRTSSMSGGVELFPEEGAAIVAPFSGTVTLNEPAPGSPMYGGGHAAYIRYPDSTNPELQFRLLVFESASSSENGRFFVTNGQSVLRGDRIGYVGSPLPTRVTESGATLLVIMANEETSQYIDPNADEWWAGGQKNFYVP